MFLGIDLSKVNLYDIQTYMYIITLLCLAYIIKEKFRLVRENEDPKVSENVVLPYHLLDTILSKNELAFYTVLKQVVGRKGVVCPKVGMKDLFYVDEDTGKDYMRYFGKISRKHVDFLICDSFTLRPICGVELAERGRQKSKQADRDAFVKKIYDDANLKLVRIYNKPEYTKKEIIQALTGVFSVEPEIEERNNAIPLKNN